MVRADVVSAIEGLTTPAQEVFMAKVGDGYSFVRRDLKGQRRAMIDTLIERGMLRAATVSDPAFMDVIPTELGAQVRDKLARFHPPRRPPSTPSSSGVQRGEGAVINWFIRLWRDGGYGKTLAEWQPKTVGELQTALTEILSLDEVDGDTELPIAISRLSLVRWARGERHPGGLGLSVRTASILAPLDEEA